MNCKRTPAPHIISAVPLARHALPRTPFSPRPNSPRFSKPHRSAFVGDPRRVHLQHLLQLRAFLRSVDYGGLTRPITPFRINTSKKSWHFRIALITNGFNSTRINTSAIFHFNPPRINTSKKHGGGGGSNPIANILPSPPVTPWRRFARQIRRNRLQSAIKLTMLAPPRAGLPPGRIP